MSEVESTLTSILSLRGRGGRDSAGEGECVHAQIADLRILLRVATRIEIGSFFP
jgi:hypothetical protein